MVSFRPEPGPGRGDQDQPSTTHVAGSAMAVMMKALGPAFPVEVKQVSQKKGLPFLIALVRSDQKVRTLPGPKFCTLSGP